MNNKKTVSEEMRKELASIKSNRCRAEGDIAALISLLKCLQKTDYYNLDPEDIQFALSTPCALAERMHEVLGLFDTVVDLAEAAINELDVA